MAWDFKQVLRTTLKSTGYTSGVQRYVQTAAACRQCHTDLVLGNSLNRMAISQCQQRVRGAVRGRAGPVLRRHGLLAVVDMAQVP